MKFRLLAFALLLSGGVSAQNPYISLQGANETAGGLTVAQPRTIDVYKRQVIRIL